MLVAPDIETQKIIARLQAEYALPVTDLTFLPLGADLATAVYRAALEDGTSYFIKLRRGDFLEASVAVPRFLSDCKFKQIIPPLPTKSGELWTSLEAYRMILYSYIAGRNGFEQSLSDEHRIEFGQALKRFHATNFPKNITRGVRREAFSSRWRGAVRSFLTRIEQEAFTEPIARETAVFLRSKRAVTLNLVNRAEQLALVLQDQTPDFILCHGDIHGWNLLLGSDNNLYLVDWDTLIFAPKERDLMFVGSGLGGRGHTLAEEKALFYQGYGPARLNQTALAYYRYERIVEDIAVICQQIFLSTEPGADESQSLRFLKSNFEPGGTIENAYRLDKSREIV